MQAPQGVRGMPGEVGLLPSVCVPEPSRVIEHMFDFLTVQEASLCALGFQQRLVG